MTDFYEQTVVGDINGDGYLTVTDIATVIYHIMGMATLDHETSMIFDLDNNSVVDIFDINLGADLLPTPW